MHPLDLIHELWDASNPTARCPHVQHDADGCRCGAVADPVAPYQFKPKKRAKP